MSQTNLQLTRGQIITEGLGRAGRPDLLVNARLWLNLFLEKQYLNQDYEWLVKEIDNQTLIEGASIPEDYVRMKTITATPNRLPVLLVEADEYEWRRRGTSNGPAIITYGTPVIAYIDQAKDEIHFWPLPPVMTPLTYNYFYYYFPELPDPTNPSNDTMVPMWGQSNDILIEEIYVRALNWNDDDRYEKEQNNVKKLLDESKMNSRDLRAGSPRFKLGKCHRRRRF